MMWYEARLKPGHHPSEVYECLQPWSLHGHHHFWDEPWWPKAYVVRLWAATSALNDCPAVDHVIEWDASEDESLYGDDWWTVQQLFQAQSDLAPVDRDMAIKLVHCLLNAQGMTERDEARFAAHLLWNRLTIRLRWRLYGKRRWKQYQQRRKVEVPA